MIITFDELVLRFKNYTDVKGKIRREIQQGRLIPITRGVYETNSNTSGKYLAGRIYGPSYLSFDYALAVYSLIPEAVYRTYTSATFQKNKKKQYMNHFGVFMYQDVPDRVYPKGILLHEENGYSYQIATPEKAFCDKLYSLPPVRNLTELKTLLFDDLRIDETILRQLDKQQLSELMPLYQSTNLKMFNKYMARS